jgi:hypothetical protein
MSVQNHGGQTRPPRLTARDRAIIGRARELADADTTEDFRRILSEKPDAEQSWVHATALGTAQHLLAELADLADRLADDAAGTDR